MAPALAFEPDLCNPTEEHQLLRETVRDFTRETIEPHADEHDRSGTFNRRAFEECGKLLRSDGVYSAKSITRTGKHDLDTAFFGHFQVDFVDTVTNLANGKFYTIEGHVLNKDVKAGIMR